MVEVVVLGAVLAGASAFGIWRLRTDGRMTTSHGDPSTHEPSTSAEHAEQASTPAVTSHDIGHSLGDRATLLQFSSAFCAPCRATRQVLGTIADAVPGVSHVEVDAESRLDLVRRLAVRRTPTTLVLDASGHEIRRASGVPRNDEVLAVLGEAVA
jgi:thiol-disulfide isomerase/thioredoxin